MQNYLNLEFCACDPIKKKKKKNSYESPKFIEDIIEPVPPPL
jgi:hypothetical protein